MRFRNSQFLVEVLVNALYVDVLLLEGSDTVLLFRYSCLQNLPLPLEVPYSLSEYQRLVDFDYLNSTS